jgi:hypothetical protein
MGSFGSIHPSNRKAESNYKFLRSLAVGPFQAYRAGVPAGAIERPMTFISWYFNRLVNNRSGNGA